MRLASMVLSWAQTAHSLIVKLCDLLGSKREAAMQPDWLKQQFAAQTTAEHETLTEPEQPSRVNRRAFLHGSMLAGMTTSMAAGGLMAQHHAAHAQPAPAANPFGKDWWPSPWGPNDERGAANRM